MGNGFIARQVQSAGELLRGSDGLLFHAKILARGLSSFRAPAIHAKSSAFSRTSLTPCTPGQFFAGYSLYHAVKSSGFTIRIIR